MGEPTGDYWDSINGTGRVRLMTAEQVASARATVEAKRREAMEREADYIRLRAECAAHRETNRALVAEIERLTGGGKIDRPTMVCLCGSTRFGDAFRDAMRTETLAGRIVLTVGLLGHQEGLDMDGPVKEMLDELHKRKIDRADEILVLNCGGYMGKSTRGEIDYAVSHGKRVRYLEDVG